MTNPFLKYKGIKYFKENESHKTDDLLAIEQKLKLSINGTDFVVLMRTPGNEEELIRGFLYTEGVFKDLFFNPEFEVLKKDNFNFPIEINIKISPDKISENNLNIRSLLSVSSCGICGKTELVYPEKSNSEKPVVENISFENINEMFSKMQKVQDSFNMTGGTHAAAAFTLNGEMLSVMEDIGRHNAVDKVIGDLIIKNKFEECSVMLLSGRASYEVISKCILADIKVLAVVSAPSSLAVDFAKKFGIVLIGFCRENRMTVYSNGIEN